MNKFLIAALFTLFVSASCFELDVFANGEEVFEVEFLFGNEEEQFPAFLISENGEEELFVPIVVVPLTLPTLVIGEEVFPVSVEEEVFQFPIGEETFPIFSNEEDTDDFDWSTLSDSSDVDETPLEKFLSIIDA